MIYALLIIVPIVGGALAGVVSAHVKQGKLISRPLTQAELFAEQKELSSWLMKTVTELDTLNPDKGRLKSVIEGLKALQKSSEMREHDFYLVVFNEVMEFVETLYDSVEESTHHQFIPYLRLLTEGATKSMLENRGKTKPALDYKNFVQMCKIRNSFRRVVSEVNAEQVKRWKTPTSKGTTAK